MTKDLAEALEWAEHGDYACHECGDNHYSTILAKAVREMQKELDEQMEARASEQRIADSCGARAFHAEAENKRLTELICEKVKIAEQERDRLRAALAESSRKEGE